MTREELDRFLTDEGRAKVKEFAAQALAEEQEGDEDEGDVGAPPANAPEELVWAAYRELQRTDRELPVETLTLARDVLAAVLPLHRQQIAAEVEAHAESIGWYEDGGVWADAIDVIKQERWTRGELGDD